MSTSISIFREHSVRDCVCVHMCTMEINACMQWALCLSKREQVANLGSRRSSQTCGSTPWLHQCIHLRFRHTLGKVLQPFAAKLNVVWSLPVDRPVSIRASGNEPSLEAQDAHSIGQSATTAHCLLARQSVAPIAILPADSSPTCLTGSRDDWSYLEGSPWDGSGLFLPPDGWTWRRRCAAFPKACGHTRVPSAPSASSVRESESDAHSASEMSCAADAASGLWLVFRLPRVLRLRFLIAVRPCASFAALAALWICFISSAARLKVCLSSAARPTIRKEAKAPVISPTLRRNKSQSEASLARSMQNSISERKDWSENPLSWPSSSKTKGQSRPLWPFSGSNWNMTMSQRGFRTLKATTMYFCLPDAGEHHCSTSGWAERSRFKGSCTLAAVTKSSWTSRKTVRSSSLKLASHPPQGQTEKRLSLTSGRSSSSPTSIKASWS